MVDRGHRPTEIRMSDNIWSVLRMRMDRIILNQLEVNWLPNTLFGMDLVVEQDFSLSPRHGRIELRSRYNPSSRVSELIDMRVVEQLRGYRITEEIEHEMQRRMTGTGDPSDRLRYLAGRVAISEDHSWQREYIAESARPATLSAESIRRARDLTSQARFPVPDGRVPECPASRIGVECRQWTNEQLQSIRTILLQEGKRRQHERTTGSTDTNGTTTQDANSNGLGETEYVSGGTESI